MYLNNGNDPTKINLPFCEDALVTLGNESATCIHGHELLPKRSLSRVPEARAKIESPNPKP